MGGVMCPAIRDGRLCRRGLLVGFTNLDDGSDAGERGGTTLSVVVATQ